MAMSLVAAWSLTTACGRGADDAVQARLARLPPTPPALTEGQQAYERRCASCHGTNASGTTNGPPLAHRVYEPSHHADVAFRLAVRNGVAAHHWRFGNMPAQPQVAETEVDQIVAYVRWVQREVGIH